MEKFNFGTGIKSLRVTGVIIFAASLVGAYFLLDSYRVFESVASVLSGVFILCISLVISHIAERVTEK